MTRTRSCRPPGPSNQAYLSLHYSEATLAKTFRACSSPATTQTKPHRPPAVLGQELVHTTLSITHHTRSNLSTSTRTPWFSISPLMSALTTHLVTNLEKKENKKMNHAQASGSKARDKARNKITRKSKTHGLPTPRGEAKRVQHPVVKEQNHSKHSTRTPPA